jgi:HEAT repeat protein
MYRLLLIGIFIGGAYYLYDSRGQKEEQQAAQQIIEPPPAPPVLEHTPPPVLTHTEIEKIRLATNDGDPQVRWAAINLLHRVRDPHALAILQKALKIDSESSVRMKALNILKTIESPDRITVLIGALNDTERGIRLAALTALAEIGDPRATPAIVKALRDTEPTVRQKALRTLGRIQNTQDRKHKLMQDQIRQEYEKRLEEHERKLKQQADSSASPKLKDLLDTNKVE